MSVPEFRGTLPVETDIEENLDETKTLKKKTEQK